MVNVGDGLLCDGSRVVFGFDRTRLSIPEPRPGLWLCMLGLLASHPRPDSPLDPVVSGVGYLMGDIGRVTHLGSLAGCVDDLHSEEAAGMPIGAGLPVVVDLDPCEFDGMPIGVVRKVVDESNPDEIYEVPTDVFRRVVLDSNCGKPGGIFVDVVLTTVSRSLGSVNCFWVCVQL